MKTTMCFIRPAVLVFLQILCQFQYGSADITIIPQNFTVQFDQNGLPSNNLTILCKPPTETTVQGVTFIQLVKFRRQEDIGTTLVTLTPDARGGFLDREAGLANRKYKLSGKIDTRNLSESFLRVEFEDGSCTDEGYYECRVHVYRDGAVEKEVQIYSASVATNTLPGRALLMQRPAYDSFVVNQSIELKCSAQVGSPPAYFRWQYRRVRPQPEKDVDFHTLTFGVTGSEGPFPQGFCKNFRTSTLWLRADLDLDGVEIRCLLVRGWKEYDDLSARFTFKVKEVGCIPECWNGGVCEETTCRCLPGYTGSFCEEPVKRPCEKDCGNTSSRATSSRGGPSILQTLLVCVFLLNSITHL